MSEQLLTLPRPRGILRWFLRLPIGLYRARLGFLLGDRFLMLTHVGRKTGQLHQTVVEVVQHDLATDTYYVVSGWGEKASWYQNIMAHPQATIQVRNQKLTAMAERVSTDKGAQIMMDYARKHPFALRELARIMKYPLDGSEASVNNLGRNVPIIAFGTKSG